MSQPGAYGLSWAEAEIDAGWQGISALRFEPVLPPGVAARLVVTLALPADGLTAADLSLNGPNGAPLDGTVRPVLVNDTTLLVDFANRGPRGLSTARLLSGGADPLHPFFAAASFDFFIDCPGGDCRESSIAPEAASTRQPALDYTTKDFDGFVQVAQNWALSTDPAWGDLSPASTEQMLLELLAHHAEMLSLHQDRVAQEAFIDSARERLSLRRHAAFLGLSLDEGACATTVVAIDVAPGQAGFLPAGTRIVRNEGQGRITATFVTATDAALDNLWNAGLSGPADRGSLRPAAWPGAVDASLPGGATSLLLLGHGLGLLPGQRIALVQGLSSHVAQLQAVEEIEAPGWANDPAPAAVAPAPQPLTLLRWDTPTAVPFVPWRDPVREPFLLTANLVDALHGETRRASNREAAGVVPLGRGRGDLVTATDPATGKRLIRALRTPEDSLLVEADGRPALELKVGDSLWQEQPDLWTSAGFDPHYTTEREDDGSVWLLFGDGLRGQALDLDSDPKIELAYRRGMAESGNLGAFALNAALPPEGDDAGAAAAFAALTIRAATNILPATGGRGAVSADVARQLIPESLRHPALERCVTADDYARAAETVPGIAQAAPRPLGGLFSTIAVLCAPEIGDDLPPALADAVHARLDALRMAGREHRVAAPDYLPLDIALLICPARGAEATAVRRAVQVALAPGSAAAPGFFHRSRAGFGAAVRLADLLATVHAAPGVRAAKALVFRPLFEAGGETVRRAILPGPTEIVQFAADEARPERGRLTVRIEGIDPPDPPAAFTVGGPAPELLP
jgi:hypothetical protein